jgi:hypothetical protein
MVGLPGKATFSLFSRRTGGRLGEEGRGDEGRREAAEARFDLDLTRIRLLPNLEQG